MNCTRVSKSRCQKDPPPHERLAPTPIASLGRVKKQTCQGKGPVKLKSRRPTEQAGNDSENCKNKHENDITIATYACPFYKRSPVHHMGCMTLKLTRLRDVRQHVQRRHAHSQTSEGDVPGHMCVDQFLSQPDIGHDAFKKLSEHRVNQKQSADEKWYELWRILFPTHPEPSSPYVGSVVAEAATLICDFWVQESPQILPAFCGLKGMTSTGEENFSELLTFVADQFQSRIEQSSPGPNHGSHHDSALQQHTTFPPPLGKISLSEEATSSGCTTPQVPCSFIEDWTVQWPMWSEGRDSLADQQQLDPISNSQLMTFWQTSMIYVDNPALDTLTNEVQPSKPFPFDSPHLEMVGIIQ